MSLNQAIKPEEVLESFHKYGDEFINMNIEKPRVNDPNDPKVYYVDITMKHPKTEKYEKLVVKFINVSVRAGIKPPKERPYEQIKIAILRNEIKEELKTNKCGEAIECICKTFTNKVKEWGRNGKISDDKNDISNGSIIFPSIKARTPLQTTVLKDNKTIMLENPMLWFNLNVKRYSLEEKEKLQQLGNEKYKKDQQKVLIKELAIKIFDLKKRLPRKNKDNEMFEYGKSNTGELLDNTNIHEFLTYNSLINGLLNFQVVISSNSFNLNTRIDKSLYVLKNENFNTLNDGFEDDDFNDMLQFKESEDLKPSANKEVEQSIIPKTSNIIEDESEGEEYEEVEETDDE